MSKMDELRALREARYERTLAGAATKPQSAAPRAVATTVARTERPKAASLTPPAAEVDEQLCGHRNMGGRTCTREHGHAAKSHRYS